MKKIDQLFTFAAKQNASDIALSSGSPPYIRVQGHLVAVQMPPLGANSIKHLISELLSPTQTAELQKKTNVDLAYSLPGVGRFRINCYMHRLGYGIVARIIPNEVPSLEELGLPESLMPLLETPNGIILVTGPSGSGKTTTQASIIKSIADQRHDHILTVEDPVEYLIDSKTTLINQREVGTHTKTFASALKSALREDPDIILIGEMRDQETIGLAMTAAETGHLVLGTLNTLNATATVNRIVDAFPGDQKAQIRQMFSGSLRSIICQKLVQAKEGNGRVLAVELLINSGSVANLIRDGRSFMIKNAMQTGKSQGMMTMDESLATLVKKGKITSEVAMNVAENKNEIKKLMVAA